MARRPENVVAAPRTTAGRAPTRRFQARRNAIIASAVEELNRRGVRGMTLGDVAARLDLVPTAVIYYFKNKEELAAACFLRSIERCRELIAAGEAAGEGPARTAGFVRAYFDLKQRVAKGEAVNLTMFNDIRALNNPQVNEAYADMFRQARTLLARPGDAPPPPHLNARTHLLLSEMFGVVAWIHHAEVGEYGRPADQMASVLIDGLAGQNAAWPEARGLALGHEDDPEAQDSAEAFLKAATELINEEGYHGASVERIAARLNVSKGAFYHYNAAKDDLVVACFQRTFEIIWRAIRAAEQAGGSGLEILVSLSAALVERQIGGGAPLLRASASSTIPESLKPELLEKFNRISYRFATILCHGIADGSIRPVDVNVAAQMITTMINAAVDLPLWAPGLTGETAVDHYVRPFFRGLYSPPAG